MKFLKTLVTLSLLVFFSLLSKNSNGQSTKKQIPFYALPYYNYDPLTITIGKYKKELLTNDTAELITLANKIKENIDNTDIESLYILSVRLYDLGKKDDAFYWFYTAQSRARIFIEMLDPNKIGSIGSKAFELKQLFFAFNSLAGEYINGYGLNDFDKGMLVFEKVRSEVKDIKSYKEVYKDISFLSDDHLETKKNNKEEELTKLIDYLKTHKDEIKKQRIANGVQDKY